MHHNRNEADSTWKGGVFMPIMNEYKNSTLFGEH